jgi:hypothetical protein
LSKTLNFDPTITIGAVFIVLSQIGSMFFYAARMDKRIDLLSSVVDHLRERIDAQGDIIKEYTKIGERFATLEGRVATHAQMMTVTQRDISDLRRGNGFITHPRDRIEGEYP